MKHKFLWAAKHGQKQSKSRVYQPYLEKNLILMEDDTNYLVVRAGFDFGGDYNESWFTPDINKLMETFNGQLKEYEEQLGKENIRLGLFRAMSRNYYHLVPKNDEIENKEMYATKSAAFNALSQALQQTRKYHQTRIDTLTRQMELAELKAIKHNKKDCTHESFSNSNIREL